MYERSASQFFRSTNGIQWGPDAFDESRFVMQLWILCSFRLVLGGKAGKRVSQSSRLSIIYCNYQFLYTRSSTNKSPKVPRAKFLGSDGLPCFISICKFGSFKKTFAKIASLSEIYFRFRGFILLVKTNRSVQTKKSDFYELWQQPEQLKTMAMSEAWPDIYDEEYIPEHS